MIPIRLMRYFLTRSFPGGSSELDGQQHTKVIVNMLDFTRSTLKKGRVKEDVKTGRDTANENHSNTDDRLCFHLSIVKMLEDICGNI